MVPTDNGTNSLVIIQTSALSSSAIQRIWRRREQLRVSWRKRLRSLSIELP